MSEVKPLRDLWIAVVFRALADAAATTGYKGRRIETREWLERFKARDWIMNNGADFREVCSMAGINPENVIEALQSGRALRILRARNQHSAPGAQRAA